MLIELLRRAAVEAPSQPVVLTPESRLDYAPALRRAEALASGLTARSVDRFGCLMGDVGDLVALLCAASAAGAEACVYPDDATTAGLHELAGAFDHDLVVTDRTLADSPPPEALPVDDLAAEHGDLPVPAECAPVLILTTGTTGEPKGVRHDWARLVDSVRHRDKRSDARWLLAYNLNQFAGVQILLHVLATRATLVAGTSREPRDAVDAMSALGVTHASATPTFWRLVLSRIDAGTSRSMPLEQITLGGEAVPAPLLDELRRRFPRARISQIYGASEFGTAVSVRDGLPGLPLTVLHREDDADVQFRIVDGELYVRSRIGMLGYHGEGVAAEGWRATGDLVEIRSDRIHFVGRSNEIINVGGVKVHPLPVEELVTAVHGVEAVHAYGRGNPVTGQVVALDVVARPSVDVEPLEAEIRSACGELPRAARPRSIRFVDQLATRGNKVDRRQTATR